MFKQKDTTRLGEILVSKGLITAEQLAIASEEQAKRNSALNATETRVATAIMLGEILVEFGFIDQMELKRGLNWQQRLRHVSIAMALCAPFMIFAPSSASAQTSSSSISAERIFTPTTIQAENYTAMSGIKIGDTTDAGAEKYVGWIDANDWLSYANNNIYVPTAGTYRITFRVASSNGGGVLLLKEASTDGTLDSFEVPKTNGWHSWVNVVRTVSLSQGNHSFKLYAKTGGFNINWFKIEAPSTPLQLPATIQAENYSDMKGVIAQATTDLGGGSNIGYLDAQDWMAYRNIEVVIPTTGAYKITYRLASLNGGGAFTLNDAGTQAVIDTVSVPKTNSWQNWISLERTLSLAAGKHSFMIKVVVGGFNINWFKIEPVTSATSSSAPIPIAGGDSSTSRSSSSTASSQAFSTGSPASSSSSSAAGTGNLVTRIKGPVALSWLAPNQRENGSFLDITEIGGYEIRYRLAAAANFTYVTINNAWTTQYNFTWLEGDYIFQIAAFDKNGIYSNFVDIHPH